ncbi:MAG: hypothetical protein H0W73_17390 [Bacteroidetes bacterium]|nr:hypothetical protein [Bacteroidota bacterium]
MFFYSPPPALKNSKAEFYSQFFIYPYFHQNWNLFAPAPTSNYKLYCEFESNGKQQLDVFSEINIKHQSNRLKGYGPFVVAFANSFHYLEASALDTLVNEPLNNNVNFQIIEHTAKKYLENTRHVSIKDLRLILVSENVVTKKQKIYFN